MIKIVFISAKLVNHSNRMIMIDKRLSEIFLLLFIKKKTIDNTGIAILICIFH
jgi:hypothetical protein